MTSGEMKNITDEELLRIIRGGINTEVPTSEYQAASRELELRDRERAQKIPWYKSWWMIYIIYPLLGILVGSIITILFKS